MARVVVVGLFIVAALVAPRHKSAHSVAGATARFAVIVVLDGARPDYFDLSRMPNLRRLMRRGIRYTGAWVGQEVANTPPSHATIGSGVFPRRHGVESFAWKDPQTGQAIRPTDLSVVQGGGLERILTQHHVRGIAERLKQRDSTARVVAVSGHKCYAADAMGTGWTDYILCAEIYHNRWVASAIRHHLPPPGAVNNPAWDVPVPPPSSGFAPAVEQWHLGEENDWTVRYGLWAFHRIHFPRLLMLNLPETDVTGHFVDGAATIERRLMSHFDAELGTIMSAYKGAGILSRTLFVITSDHGMSTVQARLPFAVLDRAIALASATKVTLEADMGAALWIREVPRARAVAANVARLGGPAIDATYYKALVGRRWVYHAAYVRPALTRAMRWAFQSEADTDASVDGPEVLAFYAPHVTTGDRVANGYHWWAGHFGPQWDEQHIPLMLAGPGIRPTAVSTFPARLVDIAPTVERALGLETSGVDGQVLADAFARSSRREMSAERRIRTRLQQVTAALRERSIDSWPITPPG